MTREEMIERLAAELWRFQVVDSGAPQSVISARTPEAFAENSGQVRRVHIRQAAAVLDLCGPKPLVWDYVSNTQTWQAKSGLGEYSVGFDDGWWGELIGNIQWEWEPDCDPRTYYGPDAAQAAAQAHYEAAHWAQTPMGDL
jgi:hypothetical protein